MLNVVFDEAEVTAIFDTRSLKSARSSTHSIGIVTLGVLSQLLELLVVRSNRKKLSGGALALV
jgi:hypothetical protein